jgi:hypothetical protein
MTDRCPHQQYKVSGPNAHKSRGIKEKTGAEPYVKEQKTDPASTQ